MDAKEELVMEVRNTIGAEADLSRDMYQFLRKTHTRLPSVDRIKKVFGGYSKFKEKFVSGSAAPAPASAPVEQVQSGTGSKKDVIAKVLAILGSHATNISRDKYSEKRRTISDLPTVPQIAKVFGTYANFRAALNKHIGYNPTEIVTKQEPKKEEIPQHVKESDDFVEEEDIIDEALIESKVLADEDSAEADIVIPPPVSAEFNKLKFPEPKKQNEHYTTEEFTFLRIVDQYKSQHGDNNPTVTNIFRLAKAYINGTLTIR